MSAIDPNRHDHGYLGTGPEEIRHAINNRLVYSIGKDPFTAVDHDWLQALSYVVRDRLIERWMDTHRNYSRRDCKRVYYLSLEFLIGRSLNNALLNIGFRDNTAQALESLGLDLETMQTLEHDAALGNGGLGRLAACILDSIATLDLPATGYGIRYEYGMFRQQIENGEQREQPENWLAAGNPWEFSRPEVRYLIRFGGQVQVSTDETGRLKHQWGGGDEVMAMAFDTPIPGYHTETVNNLRLWSARASSDFDLGCFNQGNYIKAVERKTLSENLSKVLYPDDSYAENQELRLRQQYFFVSASLQDIVRRFLQHHSDLKQLPDKVAIQLNDTHPAIAIPELMRILIDQHQLEWQPAWEITARTFSYTNHTLLPEALESWPLKLLEGLLPRHMQIIYEINGHFLEWVSNQHPGNHDLLRRLSIIEEENGQRVRMAHLAIVGSHKVNGVSALHTKLLKRETFADFHRIYPGKFINITNGITPRRWLHQSNPALSSLICDTIGSGWIDDLQQLERLLPLADDAAFRAEFAAAKRTNKLHLANLAARFLGTTIDPDSLFDVQVKRIHEYKRQLLNLLRVVTLYNRLHDDPGLDLIPRTVLIGGKAAPGYAMAKLIIRLINDVAGVIDSDPTIKGHLKLLFIPNYDVTTAGDIIPAADLSQQISTAGMEASGTGNMKLALNGTITMGTLDGANIEIHDRVGEENIFTFGLTADEVKESKARGYDPRRVYEADPELRRAVDQIAAGHFSPTDPDRYRSIVDSLLNGGDPFMVLADYRAYLACDARADRLYCDPDAWFRSAIINTARMGFFSSDRTVSEYAEKIWGITPVD